MNKKLKEVALHEKDTGSSEAQIALPVSYTHLTLPTNPEV